jgi:hypothetical protein
VGVLDGATVPIGSVGEPPEEPPPLQAVIADPASAIAAILGSPRMKRRLDTVASWAAADDDSIRSWRQGLSSLARYALV